MKNQTPWAHRLLRRLLITALLPLLVGAALRAVPSVAPSQRHFSHPDRIRYDGDCLTVDGVDIFMSSAAFHYFRTPQALWRDRFQKIKDAGFNTVETYTPWNWHERDMPAGLDDYSKVDLSELEAWLKMAHDEFGFYTVVRPGPFICAEWAGGAYPRWLAKFATDLGKEFWLRSPHDGHVAWSEHWYNAIGPLIAREQITRKPKGAKGIILVQIENEYDYYKGPEKTKVLRALYDAVKKAGVDVPVFTCRTAEVRAGKEPALSQVFDCDNLYVALDDGPSCAQRMVSMRALQPDAPAFVTELQGGWFSLTGGSLSEDHHSDARHYNAIQIMAMLGGATGLNTYMFVGGTHFGGWGARGQTTTYDYNAAIREWGALGPKYYVAKGVNEFVNDHASRLLRAEGGPCELQGAPANLFGGVRVAPDGTRFVFLHNTDTKNPVSGKVTVVPGNITRPAGPIYNTDQEGNRVLVHTVDADAGASTIPPFEVNYALTDLDARVLVIPPGKTAAEGTWYPKAQTLPTPPVLPAPVRIASALKHHDPLDGAWQALPEGKSLPELGVNDQRYVLYRSRFSLSEADAARLGRLLVNSFSRDLVTAQVNGRLAGRLYPDYQYAAAATRNKKLSFDRIRPDEFDNRFDIGGLLRAGDNEIVLLYENIGHEHGYIPMEELSGVRRAGLAADETAITKPLDWQVALDLGGVTAGWIQPGFTPKGWEKVTLDTERTIARKGNGIQPQGQRDGLLTWYRIEFELPEHSAAAAASIPWRLLLDASGNGFMWLNGHDIGRHWEIGPQREYYLPECWLNFGAGRKNVLMLGLRQTVNGAELRAAEIAPYPPAPSAMPGRAPHAANPMLPGYYADPSIVSYEGKHYIYATLDPWGGETLGCWESDDFKNWTYRVLNWPTKTVCTSPTSKSAAVWAPGVTRGLNGKFHMYISVGNEVWAGVAEHPLGPWRNALGDRPLIPGDFRPGFHMIDAEAFIDDDGQAYLYWGSGWDYKNGRCWAVKLKPDMVTFDGEVRDVTPTRYFEAPLMVKRHGRYFLMNSTGKTTEGTYAVEYAVGNTPFGPFVDGPNTPVLSTNKTNNVLSPGHHTIFSREGRDYILYHRHSVPFNPKFIGRQMCVDAITFTADGRVETITPTHTGPDFLQGRVESRAPLMAAAKITASSQADAHTAPANAIDDNYGTRWAAAHDAKGAWIQLDLGATQSIQRQLIRPEYAWKPYRFTIEASTDGTTWQVVEDLSKQPVSGSPIVSEKTVTARYLRLVFPDDGKGSDISLIEWTVL